MKKTLIILNIAGLLGALIWLFKAPDWEPLVTSIGLIGSLIALLYSSNSVTKKIIMTQRGGKKSTNYQTKGNITINKK